VKIKILFGVALGNGVDAYPGDEVEVPNHQALRLVHRGKAVLVVEKSTAEGKAKK
jgi:hypothetical protein